MQFLLNQQLLLYWVISDDGWVSQCAQTQFHDTTIANPYLLLYLEVLWWRRSIRHITRTSISALGVWKMCFHLFYSLCHNVRALNLLIWGVTSSKIWQINGNLHVFVVEHLLLNDTVYRIFFPILNTYSQHPRMCRTLPSPPIDR